MKVEVAVLGSPSLIVLMVSVNVKQHKKKKKKKKRRKKKKKTTRKSDRYSKTTNILG